jgi:hypothetical protein
MSNKDLIDKIGSTNAADRAAIERGPELLPELDAIVRDTTVPMPRRMAATRVANEIRVRALAAPPAPPPTVATVATDAREYFAAGGMLGDHFCAYRDPVAYVDALYAAGATNVQVERESLIATLPADPEARARLFAIYNREVEEFGEEFGGEEQQGHYITEAEAIEMGVPDAVGEFVLEDLRALDTGQPTITFWWD